MVGLTTPRQVGWSRRAATVGLIALALLAAAGADATSTSVAVPVASLDCAAQPQAAPGQLPDRTWVAVALCPFTAGLVDPTGEANPSRTPERPRLLHGDLGPLVTALRQPDAPPAALCTEELSALPPFWLVDRQQLAYRPQLPEGPCGRPSPAVAAALHRLH
jgi:hypothetical protein